MKKVDASPSTRDRAPTAAPNDEFARSVLEIAPTIIYVYDLKEERRVFQTRRMSELLGYASLPEGRAQGEWSALIHPDDAVQYSNHRAKLSNIGDGETMSWEFRMRGNNGEWRWFLGRDVLLERDADGVARLVVGSASDVTEQKAAQEYKDMAVSEMRHRAKNLTAVIEALSRQSRPKDRPDIGAYFDTFVGRLRALLNMGDIVLSSQQRMADLRTVSETALLPFGSADAPNKLKIAGPHTILTEQTAGGLGLAFHELATNAAKYGALANPGGTVSLTWSVRSTEGRNTVIIEWKERGGPEVSSTTHEGFGSKLIRYSVAREPGGTVQIDMEPDGLHCRIQFEQSRT